VRHGKEPGNRLLLEPFARVAAGYSRPGREFGFADRARLRNRLVQPQLAPQVDAEQLEGRSRRFNDSFVKCLAHLGHPHSSSTNDLGHQ
jgi:hypothetical protein